MQWSTFWQQHKTLRKIMLLLFVGLLAFTFGAGVKIISYVFFLPSFFPLIDIIDGVAVITVSICMLTSVLRKWDN